MQPARKRPCISAGQSENKFTISGVFFPNLVDECENLSQADENKLRRGNDTSMRVGIIGLRIPSGISGLCFQSD